MRSGSTLAPASASPRKMELHLGRRRTRNGARVEEGADWLTAYPMHLPITEQYSFCAAVRVVQLYEHARVCTNSVGDLSMSIRRIADDPRVPDMHEVRLLLRR